MELVITNDRERKLFDLPAAPDHWLHLHGVATGASLAAGALAYSITHMSGKAATSALVNTVSIGGSVFAHAGRLLAGDIVGLGIQTGTRTTAFVLEQAGESATMVGSLLASTAAAVTVGSVFLVGNTLYDIYKRSYIAKPLPETPVELIELENQESDYVVFMLEDKPAESVPDMETVD